MFCYNLNENDCFTGYVKICSLRTADVSPHSSSAALSEEKRLPFAGYKICEIHVEVEKLMITNYFLQIVKRNLTKKT